MAPADRYVPPTQFATPQCQPIYDDTDLPEPALQPDGTEVVCDCDDGLLDEICVACDGGTLSDFFQEELAAAIEDSGDVKSCSGNVSVRVAV